jgi:ubiquinone/menaquinone biosynthesis C-methylase UbiE
MSAVAERSLDTRYYRLLEDEFVPLCHQLVDDGQAYVAVILCHELFRFTYPVEPYASFTNDKDPVGFITDHIAKLIRAGRQFSEAVTPYQFDLSRFSARGWQEESLEKTTSNLYSELWRDFNLETLTEESVSLLRQRIPGDVIDRDIAGATVLDMGCGSGRYSIALAKVGAREVVGIDVQGKAYRAAEVWCREQKLPVHFVEGSFLDLPFEANTFDFVFSNGTLMCSSSIERGLQELARVLKTGHGAFLYIYAIGGIFWDTRREVREIFKRIPLEYTRLVLRILGMPSNRFIFCDTWYVPLETLTTTEELQRMLENAGFTARKVVSKVAFDLDRVVEEGTPGAQEMWGEGDHRYLLEKKGR